MNKKSEHFIDTLWQVISIFINTYLLHHDIMWQMTDMVLSVPIFCTCYIISLNIVYDPGSPDHLVMPVMRGASLYSTGQINSSLSFDLYSHGESVYCQLPRRDNGIALLRMTIYVLSTNQPASLSDRTYTLYLRWPERPEQCSGLSAQSAQADIKYIRVHLNTSGGGGKETNAMHGGLWGLNNAMQW